VAGHESATAERSALLQALGGRRGLADTALPGVVFVVVNALAGLTAATWAALALAVAALGWRLARRETVQHAVGGFLGIGIAALLAHNTGRAENFFLPGILMNTAYAVVLTGSVIVRRPLVGVLLAALEGRGRDWHRDDTVRRVFAAATLLWALGVFGLRAAIQVPLYLAGREGWLAVAKLAAGWPLTLAAVALTVVIVRRVPHPGSATAPR
jgi:hypothetical protein